MKKLKLLIFFMLISLFSFSQNWKEINTQSGILVEQSTEELHQTSNDILIEYHIFKFTNTTNTSITFSYNIIVNNELYDSENINSFTLNPNESITGIPGIQLCLFHRFVPNQNGFIPSNTQLNNFIIQINN